jgi:hypothetical protein
MIDCQILHLIHAKGMYKYFKNYLEAGYDAATGMGSIHDDQK